MDGIVRMSVNAGFDAKLQGQVGSVGCASPCSARRATAKSILACGIQLVATAAMLARALMYHLSSML